MNATNDPREAARELWVYLQVRHRSCVPWLARVHTASGRTECCSCGRPMTVLPWAPLDDTDAVRAVVDEVGFHEPLCPATGTVGSS